LTQQSTSSESQDEDRRSGRSASLVAAGIFLSRISGLIREIVLRVLFATGPVAEAFSAALQLPKILQNLLGEGSLSASFVPVYSQTLEEGTEEEATALRGAVFGLLASAVTVLVLVVILFARPLLRLILRGFAEGEKFELTVSLTRVMAVGIGLIVLGAWCLGVLNAHRKFFLSYVAPMVWNIAIIAALLVAWAGSRLDDDIARWGAWGVAVGGALQFLIQLPTVIRVAGKLRPSVKLIPQAREVLTRFVPAVASRGVVTLSTYVDLFLAAFLATGAVTIIASAQTLYLLPISVFAMGVAAADLPELARERGQLDVARRRIAVGSERILFFLVFSAVAFLSMGRLIIGALFQYGTSFGVDDTIAIWLTLAAYSIGLVPSGLSRLLQNAAYAIGDVKGPARIAAMRAGVSIVVGLLLMFSFDRIGVQNGSIADGGNLPSFSPLPAEMRANRDFIRLGAVGLALGGMVAAWAEYGLLRRRLHGSYGSLSVRESVRPLLPGATGALGVGGISAIVLRDMDGLALLICAPLAIACAGSLYVLAAHSLGSPTARQLVSAIRIRLPL